MKLSYSIPEAADATGYSETEIKGACDRGDIVKSYANTKPVILTTELQRWLDSLPHEPVRRARKTK